MTQLRRLEMNPFDSETAVALAPALLQLTGLSSLSLCGSGGLDSDGLAALASALQHLAGLQKL